MKLDKNIVKGILSLGIDYIRWTQLTPMIMIWGVVLLLFSAMFIVNFQNQTMSTMETLLNGFFQLPVIGESAKKYITSGNGNHHFSTAEIKSWILSAWSLASLFFMFINILSSSIRKPSKPWTLKQKIKIVFLAALLLFTGFILNYYANPKNFKGEAGGWIFNFSLISLIVFMISSYSLIISHFLNYIKDLFE